MATQSQTNSGSGASVNYAAGQRLHCQKCSAEVEVISPCECNPPDMVVQCCGGAMLPTTGKNIHVGDD